MLSSPIAVASRGLALIVVYHLLLIAGHQYNPTALFYAGGNTPAPPALRDSLYQFPASAGFDGQFYLYLAHDPLDRRNTVTFIDNPPMRWKRILFPSLAHAFALGHSAWIPITYILVMWLATLLGIWLLCQLCGLWGFPAWLGLGFLTIPAVAISLDRMMTDIGLVVALLAFLLAVRQERPALAFVAMALAPLTRETGVVLAGAWLVWWVWHHNRAKIVLGMATLVPFACWAIWVHLRFGPDLAPWWGWPFQGIVTRLANYSIYPAPSVGLKLALLLDYAGAWGVAASFVIALALLVRGERSLLLVAAVLYTLGISVFAKDDMWGEAYSYTRTGGPVALMLALAGLEQRRWWMLLPMAAAVPRVGFQLLLAMVDSVRGLAG